MFGLKKIKSKTLSYLFEKKKIFECKIIFEFENHNNFKKFIAQMFETPELKWNRNFLSYIGNVQL